MTKPQRVFAIINPATGQGSVRRLERQLRTTARRLGVELETRVTEYPDHATEIARECRENSIDIVVAVGGDGTVSEVVTGVFGSDIVLGIVPNGSTNMIAKELGIPLRHRAAMRVALGEGVPTPVDVGKIGDATFMHMAGAGYDADIMRDTPGKWKRRLGWPAYLWPAIKHLRATPFHITIEIDGETTTWYARMALCAIGGSIVHPRFTVGKDIDRNDGLIDVCVYDPPNTHAALSAMGWILLRRPERSRWQHQRRGKHIVLRSEQPIAFQADGTPMGELPVTLEIRDDPAYILTPRINK